MKRVTIRVPATTANLGPGFDAFGCALGLYTDVTFEETEYGLEITGCDEEFTGPDNLAPAFYGGLTASMVDNGLPVTVNFPLHPDWEFLALVPDFTLSTPKARAVLPKEVSRADAIYNISHGAMVLKALELGDEKLLRTAMQDKLHQNYRRSLIMDYEQIEALVRTTGAAFCLSGAGPTLLCITRNAGLEEKLGQKLPTVTQANWEMLPLHIDFEGARIIE